MIMLTFSFDMDTLRSRRRVSRPSGVLSAASASILRSPRRSSSHVTPKISAIAGMSARSGALSPVSQRETVLSETCRSCASSLCVMPFECRSAAMKEPIVRLSTAKALPSAVILSQRERIVHPAGRESLREYGKSPREGRAGFYHCGTKVSVTA